MPTLHYALLHKLFLVLGYNDEWKTSGKMSGHTTYPLINSYYYYTLNIIKYKISDSEFPE